MKTDLIRKSLFAALSTLLFSGTSLATTLVLPPDNYLSTGTYNDFKVLSFDLLNSCSADQPALCGTDQYPVASNVGVIGSQLTFLTGSDGSKTNNTDLGWTNADNPFMTPSGTQAETFRMGDTTVKKGNGTEIINNEPVNTFTGDQLNSWQVKISDLRKYLTGDLVFIFDNNQSQNSLDAWILFWAQASITDIDGKVVGNNCYEVSTGSGCATTFPDELTATPSNPGIFLPVISNFCVDKTTGKTILKPNSTDILFVSNQQGCPSNSYFVNNNDSTGWAEFGAYNLALSNAVKSGAYDDYWLTINVRYAANNGGFEQAWICSDCTFGRQQVPEPSSIALVGLALIGLAGMRRRKPD